MTLDPDYRHCCCAWLQTSTHEEHLQERMHKLQDRLTKLQNAAQLVLSPEGGKSNAMQATHTNRATEHATAASACDGLPELSDSGDSTPTGHNCRLGKSSPGAKAATLHANESGPSLASKSQEIRPAQSWSGWHGSMNGRSNGNFVGNNTSSPERARDAQEAGAHVKRAVNYRTVRLSARYRLVRWCYPLQHWTAPWGLTCSSGHM